MENSRHRPDPSEVLRHLTKMFNETLNPYFAWAAVRHCYEEELELPFELLIYFGTVATMLIGEDRFGHRDPEWGANRDDRCTYERALHFDRQGKKLEQYNDLKEIRSDKAAKWFPKEMLRLVEEERQKGTCNKEEIYANVGDRIGLSDSAVKQRYLKAKKCKHFGHALDRWVDDWDDGVINILPRDRIRGI